MPSHRRRSGHCTIHKNYSLSCADFDALLERSAGCCELCGAEARRLVIDHDHRYGDAAVRGLVCYRCNKYLGTFDNLLAFQVIKPRHPGRWFESYMRRAWFAREVQIRALPEQEYVDHERLRADLTNYRQVKRAAIGVDRNAILMPLTSPARLAQILRDRMSPQGFAVLVRILNKMSETPKRLP